jgi:hypothetical protein
VSCYTQSAQKSKALVLGKRFPNHRAMTHLRVFDDVTQNISPDSVRHCPKVQAVSTKYYSGTYSHGKKNMRI